MGRRSSLNHKLVEKIAKKLNKLEVNIVKSVSAMASRRSISYEAALILYAQKNNIGTAMARRKLSPEKRAEIQSVPPSNGTTHAANRRIKITKRTIDIGSDYLDPFLETLIYSNLSSVSIEAYQILYILENSLRSFVERVLFKKYGSDWWEKVENKKSISDIAKEVTRRKNTETENWHHSKRGVHEIYYTDYSHLLRFMKSFQQEFSVFFKKMPAKNLPGKLAELTPTRNIVAHNNPIAKRDLRRLQAHAIDWIAYMKELFKNKK